MYEVFERLCEAKGVTPYKVGKETGISTATFSSWKRGQYAPKDEKIKKLAEYFGVSAAYIKTGKEDDLPEMLSGEEAVELMALFGRLSEDNKKAIMQILRTMAK